MAGGEDAIKTADKADAEDTGGSIVHMEGVEKGSLFSYLSGKKGDDDDVKKTTHHASTDPQEKDSAQSHHLPHRSHQSKPVVHEGNAVNTTYDVEEDEPPSKLEQLKRKIHLHGR